MMQPVLLLLLFLAVVIGDASAAPNGSTPGALKAGSYEVPRRLDDGWRVAPPEDLGLDRKPLVKLTEMLRSGEEYPNVHGLLIAKDGHLVYEQYFVGEDLRYGSDGKRHAVKVAFGRDTLHDLRSATKSVTSALVGIAFAAEGLQSLDTPLCDVLPSHADACTEREKAITLRHALTMTPGFEWNETKISYSDPTNDEMQLYYSTDDPIGYILSKPLVSNPGTEWNYNSGMPILLGFASSRAAGAPFREFARRRLFEPLGIQSWEWRGPPTFGGDPTPAGNLWLRPRDLAKFGALYLGDGDWNGTQVLPHGWAAASTTPSVARQPARVEYGDLAASEQSYGYLWWHDRYTFADGLSFEVVSARGLGGQRIWIVPGLGLLVVHLTGRYVSQGAPHQAERLLLERIIPWALGEAHPRPRLPRGRPVVLIGAEGWKEVALDPAERSRYIGTYDEQGEPVEVWEEDGVLKMTPPPGDDQREIHLIPEGGHTFAQGFYEDGRPVKIYWPEARIIFEVADNVAQQYEVRHLETGEIFVTAQRVP